MALDILLLDKIVEVIGMLGGLFYTIEKIYLAWRGKDEADKIARKRTPGS